MIIAAGKIARYVRGISLYFGASAIPLMLSVIINPIIAMNMSPRDYAITGYFTSFNSLLTPLIQFYLIGYYLKQFFRLKRSERIKLYALIFKNLIYLSAIITIFAMAILYIYIDLIHPTAIFPVLPYLILAIAPLSLAGIYNLRLADLRIRRKNGAYFRLSVAHGITGMLATLLLVAVFHLGAIGKLSATLTVELIFFTTLIIAARRILSIDTHGVPMRPIILFCAPLVAGAMMQYFADGYTATYLESLGNVTEYGLYIVGASIGSYIMVFSCAVSAIFQPDFYHAIANSNRIALLNTLTTEFGIIILVVTTFIILAPYLVNVLTAGRYTASTYYARITSLGAITSAIFYRINSFSIATDHKTFYLFTTITGSLAIIFSMPLVTRYYGYIGGAYLRATSYLIFAIINIILLKIAYQRKHRIQ